MKHLLAVSVPAVLALVVIVSVACEGPGPTPPPPPAPEVDHAAGDTGFAPNALAHANRCSDAAPGALG